MGTSSRGRLTCGKDARGRAFYLGLRQVHSTVRQEGVIATRRPDSLVENVTIGILLLL